MDNEPSVNLKQVHSFLTDYWKKHPGMEHFSALKLTQFEKKDGFPCMKGRAVYIKSLLRGLQAIFPNFIDRRSRKHVAIQTALDCAVGFDEIVDNTHGLNKLPFASARKFEQLVHDYLALNTFLVNEFKGDDIVFNSTIKSHYMIHVALMAYFCHPAHAWCFGGESFMKVVKFLVLRNARGTCAHLINNKVVDAWARIMHYKLDGKSPFT
eukprot:8850419-Pyramimonas_sp.AAC.1